ncbi:UNVERIFIED_CONTAM: Transcription factor [Sesamum angustifolium]|uniref:Transcription factor n=1 Tax=Sesamum angustifolium TaxID=2727405 RepID=A0AAW2QPC9_9LAMI
MGRAPCCDKANVKKGPWSPEEDAKLKEFIEKHGTGGNWIALSQKAGKHFSTKSSLEIIYGFLEYILFHFRSEKMWKELQIKVAELSEATLSMVNFLMKKTESFVRCTQALEAASQLPGGQTTISKNWNTKLKKKLIGIIPSGQGKLSQAFPGNLQTPQTLHPQFPLSGLSQLYNSFYSHAASNKSLAGPIEPISDPQSFLYCNNNNNNFPFFTSSQSSCNYQGNQEMGLVDLQCNYALKENMLMFGGNENSCSSSDGSCSQISYGGKDHVKQEEIGGLQGFMISNGLDENHKFMLHCGKINQVDGDDHHHHHGDPLMISSFDKANGVVKNSELEYDLEEVKLISSSGSSNFMFMMKTRRMREGCTTSDESKQVQSQRFEGYGGVVCSLSFTLVHHLHSSFTRQIQEN